MNKAINRRKSWILSIVALPLVSVFYLMGSAALKAEQDSQQSQQNQNQGQSQQEAKPKKGGGIFGGLKSITGSSSEQTSATASAGAKGVGEEGKKMAALTPSAADVAAVTSMDQYSVPAADLKKFQQDGNLLPKQ
jgi:hypothetical protein